MNDFVNHIGFLCHCTFFFIIKIKFVLPFIIEQGPTRHRPMAHPVVFIYLSYSTSLAEHAIHRLGWCPAFGRAGTCLFLSVH